MIPSDHFVYFYNEVFKFLAECGKKDLDRYYARVADRQANFALDQFRRDGLKGMFDYNSRIKIEENCDMDLDLQPDFLHVMMRKCPSLTKAMDSDNGTCPIYCDHCPGWILRVASAAGFWEVYDIVSRTKPVCEEWIFADRALARRKYDELVRLRGGTDLVKTNLDVVPPFIANSIADSARFEFMNPHFRKAFGFLRSTDLKSLADGKIEIDGDNVFAYVSSPELTPFDKDGEAEVHRKYIDIHTPIVGEETIGTFTMTDKELALPFNEKDDSVLFKAKGEPVTLRPGEFIAFFPPYGAHRPGCTMAKVPPKGYRKICVKVKVEK